MTLAIHVVAHDDLIERRCIQMASAEFRHWFAEVCLNDAPLGSFGPNAQLSRLAESVEDRRARIAVESATCRRPPMVREIDRRHRGRAW